MEARILTVRHFALGTLLLATAATRVMAGSGSATNGVYGGYVGSDRWFRTYGTAPGARSSGGSGVRQPFDSSRFTEVAVTVRFPDGNPFPGGNLPDLRVLGPKGDIGARTWPTSKTAASATFTLVLEKGSKYRLQWGATLGGSEDFALLTVLSDARTRRSVSIDYRAPRRSTPRRGSDPSPPRDQAPSDGPDVLGPSSTTYERPTVGPGAVRPAVGPGYLAPVVGPGYVPPR